MTPARMAAVMAQVMPETRCWSAEEFAELTHRSGSLTTGTDRCCVIGQVIAGEAEVFMVLTDPAHQRKGFARDAMQAFQMQAKTLGATRVILDVATDNVAACALYDSLGYTQIAERKAYYQRGENARVSALMLEKRL